MPIPMRKAGGGGHYGVAQVRLTKSEVVIQDVDTQDRYVFPLDPAAPPKSDKSNLAAMLRGGKAGRVVYPKTTDRPEKVVIVHAGEFGYAINAKGDMLYSLSPARDAHRCRYAGFYHSDPKLPPALELGKAFKDSEAKMEFTALFRTTDTDVTPGLEVRCQYWPYRFFPDKDETGRDVMGMSLLSDKAKSTALVGQYALYEAAGIIGFDEETKQMSVLVTVPGALENYLGPVERILLDRLKDVDWVLNFAQKVNEDTGRRKVNVVGLYKDLGTFSPKPKRGKR